jgi:hypothetical protein
LHPKHSPPQSDADSLSTPQDALHTNPNSNNEKKSSTKLLRSLQSGPTDARHSLFTRRIPATEARRRLGEGGFVNLRVLLGLFLGFTGVALAIFAGQGQRGAPCL